MIQSTLSFLPQINNQPQQTPIPIALDVSIFHQLTGDHEYYCDIPSTFNTNGEFNLTEMINHFTSQELLPSKGAIYYWDPVMGSYIFYNQLRVGSGVWVSCTTILQAEGRNVVYLKFKALAPQPASGSKQIGSYISIPKFSTTNDMNMNYFTEDTGKDISERGQPFQSIASSEINQTEPEDELDQGDLDEDDSEGKRKRHKERTIQEAMNLVTKWREFYQGVLNPETKRVVRYSLVEAAEKVGVPKKSLDDYLLMLNHGRKLGFNFASMKNERFGVLRRFVKKNKKKTRKAKFVADFSDDDE